jgi:predicted alpha-1,6-mannanase (GH76 family)
MLPHSNCPPDGAGSVAKSGRLPFAVCRRREASHHRQTRQPLRSGIRCVSLKHPMAEAVLFALLLFPRAGTTQSTAADPQLATDFLTDAAAGLKTLQNWYVRETGLWRTTGWWNAANSVTVLVRYSKLSGSWEFRPAIANTFKRNSRGRFLNEFYDDEGWWALAWASAYEWSRDARYLEMAEQIFADMTTGWDDTCGGGIWWKKDRHYKNAIANELFLDVAATLANLVHGGHRRAVYSEWAQREWQWFAASGMLNPQNLVNDGLDSTCRNNHRTTWTYNQGVILGGLSMLAKQTGDAKLLERAQSIALAAISRLTDQHGILHDTCEPNCGADGVQFKGIFARNLAVLNSAASDVRFRIFLQTNAEEIWRNGDPNHRFGVLWSGPSDLKNAATQVSALDALLAAAESTGATARR